MEKKNKIVDKWSSPSHRGSSYDHSARTLQQEEDLAKKIWIEKQKLEKQKDVYDEKKYGIKQRLKNVSGSSDWDVIWENMSPYERGFFNAERRKHGEPLYVPKKNKK